MMESAAEMSSLQDLIKRDIEDSLQEQRSLWENAGGIYRIEKFFNLKLREKFGEESVGVINCNTKPLSIMVQTDREPWVEFLLFESGPTMNLGDFHKREAEILEIIYKVIYKRH